MGTGAPTEARSKKLSRTVVGLGIVSLLTDVAADMVVPYLPLFLTVTLGASTTFVGLVEGVAESTASLVKYYAGKYSDRLRRKKALIAWGYGVASFARPLLAIAAAPWHVLAIRFIDRVGKGVRTAPRDALIAATTPPESRAFAFGFHRGMDNLGAFLGPLVAFALLSAGFELRHVFAATLVPGLLAVVVLLLLVRERDAPKPAPGAHAASVDAPLGPRARAYFFTVALFTLANASDGFLMLRGSQLGVPLAALPLAWGGLSLVRAVAAVPGGYLADRIGKRLSLAIGWFLYSICYLGFALATSAWQLAILVVLYGGYYGLTEGAEKAVVAELVPKEVLGRAYGVLALLVGVLALPSSLMFGILYERVSPFWAFGSCAALAALAACVLLVVGRGGTEARAA